MTVSRLGSTEQYATGWDRAFGKSAKGAVKPTVAKSSRKAKTAKTAKTAKAAKTAKVAKPTKSAKPVKKTAKKKVAKSRR